MTVIKKLSIGLFGGAGRMGQALHDEIANDHSAILFGPVPTTEAGRAPDVVIDFSSPDGAVNIARWCLEKNIPLVSGTTGLSKNQLETLWDAAKKIPVFFSPNMSPGVNALAEALKAFLKNFPAGVAVVEEIHHIHKKDAPSGTAKFFQKVLKETAQKDVKIAEPVSHRQGDVFGIHKIKIATEGESICFEHVAQNRSIFAKGALRAAHWLVKQSPGHYEMKDMMK